jgi:anti-sigma B factor antagonist
MTIGDTMSQEFEIDAYRKEQDLMVVLRGRLVLRYCQDVKSRLTSLFNTQVVHVYLYLENLSFLDSAGLGVLVGLKMMANRNRTSLTFLSPPARVEDIFRVSKLNTIFEIRSGPDADVIYASMKKDDYLLWSSGKEQQQSMYVTEHNTGNRQNTQANLTQMPINDSPLDDITVRVHQLCDEAIEHIRQANYEKAVQSYQEALRLDPKNLSTLNNLGVVYEKKPEWYGKSIQIWQQLLDLSEKNQDEKHASRARKHIENLSKLVRSGD